MKAPRRRVSPYPRRSKSGGRKEGHNRDKQDQVIQTTNGRFVSCVSLCFPCYAQGAEIHEIFGKGKRFSERAHTSLILGLVVRGQVTQPWRRADVGRILEMVPGVRSLENEVEVLPLSGMDDSIRRQVAAAIYRNPVLSRYGVRANPPIHIIVKNGNVVLTGFVHTTLEKSVAERAARFAATYFSLENQLQVENSETTQTSATGAKQST